MASLNNHMAEACRLLGGRSLPGIVNGGGETSLGARIGIFAVRCQLTDAVFITCFKAPTWPRQLILKFLDRFSLVCTQSLPTSRRR